VLLSVPTRASGKTTSSSPDRCLRLPILRHDASVLLVKGERKGRLVDEASSDAIPDPAGGGCRHGAAIPHPVIHR